MRSPYFLLSQYVCVSVSVYASVCVYQVMVALLTCNLYFCCRYSSTAALTSRQLNLRRVLVCNWFCLWLSTCRCLCHASPVSLLCLATLQLSSSVKQKACCLISARVAKLPSCRAAEASSALPRLATFCRLSCCFMCNIFTTLRRQQQRQVQNALSSDKWHNATTTATITTATYNNN